MIINDANLSFGSLSKRQRTTMLILHHAAGSGPVEQIHDYHKNTKGWSGIGYHFYVRKDGSVWYGSPVDTVGAHTLGYNAMSVGICFEGNFENETMSAEQKAAGMALVSFVRKLYPSITEVKGHGELKNTACPGAKFPLAEIARGEEKFENRVKQFQTAAISDGFSFPKYGADGKWGSETESVARQAVCKKRPVYRYKNLTRLVQAEVGAEVDGKFGSNTRKAVIAYQKANGLMPDGAWGINCWRRYMEV